MTRCDVAWWLIRTGGCGAPIGSLISCGTRAAIRAPFGIDLYGLGVREYYLLSPVEVHRDAGKAMLESTAFILRPNTPDALRRCVVND